MNQLVRYVVRLVVLLLFAGGIFALYVFVIQPFMLDAFRRFIPIP